MSEYDALINDLKFSYSGKIFVLIRVLQETESIGYVYFQKEISYKELARVIVEARRSRDLQGVSACWRLRKAETLVLVCVPKPETQEEPVFPFKSKGGRKADIPV